jgi:5-methylcytosine-specific restriction endonuclease McrA
MAKIKFLKKDLNKALVDERKKMRAAQKESRFKQRTLNIFKNQVVRAKELNLEVYYNIEEFRQFVKEALEKGFCYYCGCKLTVNSFVCDHATPVSQGGSFNLYNSAICCAPCNFRKGALSLEEFNWFNKAIDENLSPESATDVRKRLVSGGKWISRNF